MTDNSPQDPFGSIPIADNGEKLEAENFAPVTKPPRTPAGRRPVSPSSEPGPDESKLQRIAARQKKNRSRLAWLVIVPVVGFFLYLLAGYLLIPHLLKNVLPGYLARAMERSVTVGGAEFNPFSLKILLQNTIIGPKQTDPADTIDPLLSFGRLELDLAGASLFRFGLVCNKVELERLFLHVVRNEDSSYNFLELLRSSGSESAWPLRWLRFSLNNITVSDSRLIFEDRPAEKTHAVEEINLALPTVANLAYRPDQYLNPRFSAKINGSPLNLTGETKMTAGALEARLSLRLTQVDLPSYFAYLPVETNFFPGKGLADLDLDLVIMTEGPKDSRLQIEGTGRLTDVWLQATRNSKDLAKLPEVKTVVSFSPLSGRYRFKELTLRQPEFHLDRDPDGQWLFPRFTFDSGAMEIDRLLLTAGRLSLVDRKVKGGFAETWSELQLSIDGFSTSSKNPATFAFSGRNREQARFSAQGRLFPAPLRAEGIIIGHQLQLAGFNPYLEEKHRLRLRAGELVKLEGSFTAAVGDDGRFDFSGSELSGRIDNLSLARQDERWLQLEQFAFTDSSLQWLDRRLGFGNLRARGGSLLLAWDREGRLNWDLPNRVTDSAGWQLTVKRADLEETAVTLRTMTLPEVLSLEFRETKATFTDWSNLAGQEGNLTGSSLLFGESPVELAGAIGFFPLVARLEVRTEALSLPRLAPLFSGWFKPTIDSGSLQAQGEFHLPGPVFLGALRIDQFSASREQREILRWERGAADNLSVQFATGILSADEVRLQQPFASWTLAGKKGPKPAALFALSWLSEAGSPRLSLGHLRLESGELAFTDPAASPPYATLISSIDGLITPLASSAESNSRLALTGKSGDAALGLKGVFNPFTPQLAAELEGEVRDFELAALSPYLAEQLGYRLTGGNLDLNVSLTLRDQLLQTTNRLRVKGLRYGEPVARSSQLPLTLALLTSPDDQFELNIPVSGHTAEPNFSYRQELRRPLRHLLLKTAVSPFSVLKEAAPEALLPEYFAFSHGRTDLTPESETQLQQLAKLLRERPLLRVALHGFADGGKDREAIRIRKEAEEKIHQLAREARLTDKLTDAYGKEKITPLPTTTGMAEPRPQVRIPDNLLRELAMGRSERVYRQLTDVLGIPAHQVIIGPVTGPVEPEAPGRPGNRVELVLTVTR
jgi:hypothetical protein